MSNEIDRKPHRTPGQDGGHQAGQSIAPGKVTRTSRLPAGPARTVQTKASPATPGPRSAGVKSGWELTTDSWMDAAHRGASAGQAAGAQPPVQLRPEDPAEELDYDALAEQIHTAIAGLGTDEAAVTAALQRLGRDPAKIARLKRVYLGKYNTTLESDILGDFSGAELQTCLDLLGHTGATDDWGQTHEVDRQVTETISNAPAAYSAWNGTYAWQSKYQLYFNHDQNELVVRLRLYSTAADDVKQRWKNAVESKWGNKFCLEATRDDGTKKTYRLIMQVDWVDDAADAHYTITANDASATEGGRSGTGGTTSMTGWGTTDTVDITHEVGHMLGSPEDYFTTDGVDHTHGGTRRGFRDAGGGIMNNPSEDPFARHYESIRTEAAAALGLDEARCKIM